VGYDCDRFTYLRFVGNVMAMGDLMVLELGLGLTTKERGKESTTGSSVFGERWHWWVGVAVVTCRDSAVLGRGHRRACLIGLVLSALDIAAFPNFHSSRPRLRESRWSLLRIVPLLPEGIQHGTGVSRVAFPEQYLLRIASYILRVLLQRRSAVGLVDLLVPFLQEGFVFQLGFGPQSIHIRVPKTSQTNWLPWIKCPSIYWPSTSCSRYDPGIGRQRKGCLLVVETGLKSEFDVAHGSAYLGLV
jgi:hypothetical protein